VAPTAGAGWATVNLCVKGVDACYPGDGVPPQAKDMKLDYAAGGVTVGGVPVTPENVSQFIERRPADGNCTGCHGTPDRKKSGRSWAATHVHRAGGVGCVNCHPAGTSARHDLIAAPEMHEIAKGDITIGSVRDDVDDTIDKCVDCHLLGRQPAGMVSLAPDPTAKHLAIPPLHFEALDCQACHVRYLQDSALTTGTPEVPEIFIDMVTTGKQAPSSPPTTQVHLLNPGRTSRPVRVELTRWKRPRPEGRPPEALLTA
jgi:hypothetical protein